MRLVMPAYAAPAWAGFATAVATAAATLAGLVFVAVSINLQRILQFPNLPGRAGQYLVPSAQLSDDLNVVNSGQECH